MRFSTDSTALTSVGKKRIEKAFDEVSQLAKSGAQITVRVTGWVQPTRVSPNINRLSEGRARAVVRYLKTLGLEAKYVITAPGEDKANNAKSRRASTLIEIVNLS